MQEKRGKFIVFEGIDGCGKSTILWNFANYLFNQNKYVHLLITREPYKKREIRKILRQDSNPESQKEKLTELFIQDRKEHLQEVIEPALKKGVWVISDRYKYSTLVYQWAQGMPIEKLIEMHSGFLVPDIVFILDVPVEVAVKRMKKDVRKEHKFEANLDFLEKVRHNYLKLPKLLPEEKIFIVDGEGSIGDTTEAVIEIFESNRNQENL